MLVKILDVDLIRRFGGARIDMDQNTALRYHKIGKVKFIEEYDTPKFPDLETVINFTNENKESLLERFPKPEDPIFPQIELSGADK